MSKTYTKEQRIQAFWEKVSKIPGGCWLWRSRNGKIRHGIFWDGTRFEQAHRYSFKLQNGEIPTGMCVLHTCDVPNCVNPKHLFLGTKKDNAVDMVKKGRRKGGAPKGQGNCGAKLTNADVLDIRKRHEQGEKTCNISELYKVTPVTIRNVISKRCWGHI